MLSVTVIVELAVVLVKINAYLAIKGQILNLQLTVVIQLFAKVESFYQGASVPLAMICV